MIKDDNFYDETWNPITGSSDGIFPYPYAKKLCERFSGDIRHNLMTDYVRREGWGYVLDKPFPSSAKNHFITCPAGTALTVHNYRFNQLSEKFKSGRNILVCQMGNLFDEELPEKYFWKVIETCHANPQHNYIFLVARGEQVRVLNMSCEHPELFTENMWFGFPTLLRLHGAFKKIGYGVKIFLYIDSSEVPFADSLTDYLDTVRKDIEAEYVDISWILSFESQKSDVLLKLHELYLEFGIPAYVCKGSNAPKQLPEVFKHHTVAPGKKKTLLANCGCCGKEFRKSEMYTICSYLHRGDSFKPIGWVCQDCYGTFKERLNGQNE